MFREISIVLGAIIIVVLVALSGRKVESFGSSAPKIAPTSIHTNLFEVDGVYNELTLGQGSDGKMYYWDTINALWRLNQVATSTQPN